MKQNIKVFVNKILAAMVAVFMVGNLTLSCNAANADFVFDDDYLKNVSTAVDNLSDEQISAELKKEIDIYKNRKPEMFTIDDELVAKADPRMLLLIMKKINNIFDKFKTFTRQFIKRKKAKEKISKLFYISNKFHIKLNGSMIYWATANCSEINLNPTFVSDLNKTLCLSKYGVESKFKSPVDFDQLVESTIAHEMGHVIQNHLFLEHFEPICKNVYGSIYSCAENFDQNTKNKILKIAKEKYAYTENGVISEYGETNPSEWFAEAFAHSQCCSAPNPIGRAMNDYLAQMC